MIFVYDPRNTLLENNLQQNWQYIGIRFNNIILHSNHCQIDNPSGNKTIQYADRSRQTITTDDFRTAVGFGCKSYVQHRVIILLQTAPHFAGARFSINLMVIIK